MCTPAPREAPSCSQAVSSGMDMDLSTCSPWCSRADLCRSTSVFRSCSRQAHPAVFSNYVCPCSRPASCVPPMFTITDPQRLSLPCACKGFLTVEPAPNIACHISPSPASTAGPPLVWRPCARDMLVRAQKSQPRHYMTSLDASHANASNLTGPREHKGLSICSGRDHES